MTQAVIVNCGSCTACCRSTIMLEHSDDASKYATREVKGKTALAQKPDGTCVYLGPQRCMIWEDRPSVCRTFDCGAHYRSMSSKQRKLLMQRGQYHPDIYKAGKARSTPEAIKRQLALEVVRRLKERINGG